MNKYEHLNNFLNELDAAGVAVEGENEYNIEADALIKNFSIEMSASDVGELFFECFYHFFNIEYHLNEKQKEELMGILLIQ